MILLFLLAILKIFITEGFEDLVQDKTKTQDQTKTANDYNRFKTFYNEFINNWNKAVTTALVSSIPIEKMPSGPYKPTLDDMNKYITILTTNEKKPFPKMTALLPDELNVSEIIPRIPQDPIPYINALTWMNSNLQASMVSLGSSIMDIKMEAFEDKCQDLSNCMNNPNFLAKLSDAQKKNELDQIKSNEKILSDRINAFFSNKQVDELVQINRKLIKDADDIKNRAQSGKLVDSLIAPDKKKPYVPDKIDPKIKDEFPLIASIKSLLNGINSGGR